MAHSECGFTWAPIDGEILFTHKAHLCRMQVNEKGQHISKDRKHCCYAEGARHE
jgi:hypothetical protein